MATEQDSKKSSGSRDILTSLKSKIHRHGDNTNSSAATSDMANQQDGSAADSERGKLILTVFDNAFGELLKDDPGAFQTKFRKMAASPFAFYRGSACLFYKDLEQESEAGKGPYLDEKTARIWMHGDLHAENFGTYSEFICVPCDCLRMPLC
jgi:hypothetical protein